MTEITIKVDIPVELKEEFEAALAKALKDFILDLKFGLADKMLSKSKLTDKQIKEMLGR
jgi:hypothetical protein